MAVLLAAMYWPTWRWMWDRWNQKDDYFSHGMFVPVVAVILILIKQARIKKATRGTVPAGLYLIVGSILVHLFAVLWGINFLSGLTIVSMLVGMELYFLGSQITRVLIWPTLFLVFMIPLPQVSVDFVATQSKFVAAKVSVWAMQQVGYEVVGAEATSTCPRASNSSLTRSAPGSNISSAWWPSGPFTSSCPR